ncbi:MAG: hypothetical protein N2505_00445 [Endomicrobia bacterium]|nr:hypothetical protein [Endomicrobiia bacterium]
MKVMWMFHRKPNGNVKKILEKAFNTQVEIIIYNNRQSFIRNPEEIIEKYNIQEVVFSGKDDEIFELLSKNIQPLFISFRNGHIHSIQRLINYEIEKEEIKELNVKVLHACFIKDKEHVKRFFAKHFSHCELNFTDFEMIASDTDCLTDGSLSLQYKMLMNGIRVYRIIDKKLYRIKRIDRIISLVYVNKEKGGKI